MSRGVAHYSFVHSFILLTKKGGERRQWGKGNRAIQGTGGGELAASQLGERPLAGRIGFGTTTDLRPTESLAEGSLPQSRGLTPRNGDDRKEGSLWAPQCQLITPNGTSSNISPPWLRLLELGRKEPSEAFRTSTTHFSLEQVRWEASALRPMWKGVRKALPGSPTSLWCWLTLLK